MHQKIEGIILYKTPFKDRHLIANLLLRSGRQIPIMFFGGQGGGKKIKSSILEIGHMISVEVSFSRKGLDMYQAKEWAPLWIHEKIRLNHEAYYLLCFILEAIKKMSSADDLHDDNLQFDKQSEGLFRVTSNFLVHCENRIKESKFHNNSELFIFLGKLLIEQGVFPERNGCSFCGENLEEINKLYLMPEHGGFSCPECVNNGEFIQDQDGESGRELWELLGVVANHKYQDLKEMKMQRIAVIQKLLHYFCFQFNFKPKDFKSLSFFPQLT